MDLLKNPFHILCATLRDNQHRIMDLAEERSLLLNSDECMKVRSTLNHPRNRISAEVAWIPGVDPIQTDVVLKQIDPPHQNLLNIIGLTPIARANVLVAGLSRLSDLMSHNIMEWILAIAHTYERINAEEVREILNEERNISGFPQISDLSIINYELQKQKQYYIDTLSSALNNVSLNERSRMLTLTLETVIDKDNNRCPVLIDDLVKLYELEVKDDLEKKQKTIEALDKKIRAMAEVENPDTALQPIVNQLLETLKEWDAIAQSIQLSKRSRGERHDASFEIAGLVRQLAVDLYNDYLKLYFSQQIINTLKEVFTEVSEVDELVTADIEELKKQAALVKGVEKFEEIRAQVEKLEEAADAKKPDYILSPMVDELIQTVRTWNPSNQLFEANEAAAFTVRRIAINLWNEHQKLNFSILIIKMLCDVFQGLPKVSKKLLEDKAALEEQKRMKKMVDERRRDNSIPGWLWKYIIIGILFIIGAMSQNC